MNRKIQKRVPYFEVKKCCPVFQNEEPLQERLQNALMLQAKHVHAHIQRFPWVWIESSVCVNLNHEIHAHRKGVNVNEHGGYAK